MDRFPFDAAASQYSRANAYSLARASAWAYDNQSSVEQHLATHGLHLRESIQDEDSRTECFVACDSQKVIVAFRGTQEPIGFLTDGQLVLTPWQNVGSVHWGFADRLQSVWNRLAAALGASELQGLPLWLTGHSLGGALATLAAARLEIVDGRHVAGLYTFGCPRVGDDGVFCSNVTRKLGNRIYRVVNEEDLVPHVPLEAWGYKHVGTVELFHANGTREEKYEAWVAAKALFAVVADVAAVVVPWVVDKLKAYFAPHEIATYVGLTANDFDGRA
jgi:triacylglycerol lipase